MDINDVIWPEYSLGFWLEVIIAREITENWPPTPGISTVLKPVLDPGQNQAISLSLWYPLESCAGHRPESFT